MSDALHDALFSELTGTAAITAIVGSGTAAKIWRVLIPQRVKDAAARYPCLVIAVGALERQVANCGTVATVDARVSIDCYALSQPAAWALAREVRLALIDFRGMLGGTLRVRAASLEAERELVDLEPGTYRVMQSWQIWHKES